jgi:hypothetical protein
VDGLWTDEGAVRPPPALSPTGKDPTAGFNKTATAKAKRGKSQKITLFFSNEPVEGPHKKAYCVLWMDESDSNLTRQANFDSLCPRLNRSLLPTLAHPDGTIFSSSVGIEIS